jgi:dienelactone hydrolase
MRKLLLFLPLCVSAFFGHAQKKKPLDPSVYDSWQSIGERMLSPDGKYLVYTVVAQEGDGRLVVRSTSGSYIKEIPRGAEAATTADSRFVVFHIKPFFKDTREAKIKKKKPEQMPKDSLGWIELGTDRLVTVARVKSYALPEKNGQWLAYLLEKPEPAKGPDSLKKSPDSLKMEGGWEKAKKPNVADSANGADLVLRDLRAGTEKRFPLTNEYSFSRAGNVLVVEMTRRAADSLSKAAILWMNTGSGKVDTVMRGFSEAKHFALDEAGEQLAFVAERDSAQKALVKFYKLWYYRAGMDSAKLRADNSRITAALAASSNQGMPVPTERLGFTVSSDYANHFSKAGRRLFIGLAPIRPPKDTTVPDFETARLDVWNYNDDYLQPEQLVQLNTELKRSYLCVLPKDEERLIPLADANCESVFPSREGDGRWALGTSTRGYRIENQWEGNGLRRVFVVDMNDGSRKPVRDGVRGSVYISPGGNYILWYDWKARNWYTYSIASGTTANVTAGIPVPLYDEEDDHPDDAPPHGYMGWLKDDGKVFIYDKYDIWQCDPSGKGAPVNLTRGIGRRQELTIRYVPLEEEERGRPLLGEPVVHEGQWLLLSLFNQRDMGSGQLFYRLGTGFTLDTMKSSSFAQSYNGFFKAKDRRIYGWLQGSFDKPYDIFVKDSTMTSGTKAAGRQLSGVNPQQADYNWLTVELHHFTMLDGKPSQGLLYKPEDFDPTKKYPIIFYFYERDARTRYSYISPQPVRASINVAYFVSNGYLVFDPDIFYKTGQPGEDAYNSVMAAAQYLSRFTWVDTAKMGLQGHSWGGYQVAYLVTRTHSFAAAEAGAPVANMTSAYGGIRWESGISRQFQYEHSQSRLGASLWEKPELYIRNSPLFNADKVTTPLLMMANDADGAVPWYQGIEYFSALRRLGKKVWMMEYNGEGHGLTERRDRKDWSMRLSQFFDYYLKGAHAPRWMTEGVPATMKGIDWGLGTD